MALIQCRECGKDISSNAPACPSCGQPSPRFANLKASPVIAVATVQLTSKALKKQVMLSAFVFMAGMMLVAVGNARETAWLIVPGFVLVVVSSVWAVITKTRIWWNHE